MADQASDEVLIDALEAAAAPGGIATPEFVAAVLIDGDDDLAAWALGQALEEQPRATVFDDVVRRAMEIVGSAWESGRWSIAQEHLATVALMRALGRLGPPDREEARLGPVAVLAAPEGEQHVTGLTCLAQILEDYGWRAENLGANVPAADLQAFVGTRDVDLVALSISSDTRLPALEHVIHLLREGPGRQMAIMVGGRGVAGSNIDIAGADHVGTSLVDAETFISRLADGRT